MPPESRQALSRERDVDALSVRPIRADELAARADEWSALASCSGVDPLFMSHAWLTTWWEVFGSEPGVEEACFGAIDPDGRIVGIFPLFERAARIRGVLPVRRLEWMGGFWNGPSSVLTQYTEVVGDPDLCPELIRAFVGAIADRPGWDELIVDRIRCDSPTLPLLIAAAEERGWFVRLTPLGPSRVIDLTDGFESYRASLSGKTRRRVFNLRRRLS